MSRQKHPKAQEDAMSLLTRVTAEEERQEERVRAALSQLQKEEEEKSRTLAEERQRAEDQQLQAAREELRKYRDTEPQAILERFQSDAETAVPRIEGHAEKQRPKIVADLLHEVVSLAFLSRS